MELDCTSTSNGMDRIIKAGGWDDGTVLVTNSSKSASAGCGRLGDGRSLPVYIIFSSGESFEPAWAPRIVSDCIFDKEGKGLPWRYSSNAKGSVNEDLCKLYIEEMVCPTLGYPKPRDTDPGNQGVIICDGVETHLSYAIVERAVKLGLEIMLRVPHLSKVLQEEDTVNFKASVTNIIIVTSCVALVILDHVPVVFVAFVVVVADHFNATTNVVHA
jgi:hypothetical protein